MDAAGAPSNPPYVACSTATHGGSMLILAALQYNSMLRRSRSGCIMLRQFCLRKGCWHPTAGVRSSEKMVKKEPKDDCRTHSCGEGQGRHYHRAVPDLGRD